MGYKHTGVISLREMCQKVINEDSEKYDLRKGEFARSKPSIALPEEEIYQLDQFFASKNEQARVLLVVGGGTAALTYLNTEESIREFTHVLILGDIGYWKTASHRLAQPHHILALPNTKSHEYIDPATHDSTHHISAYERNSAYVHSTEYQSRLEAFSKETLSKLERNKLSVMQLKTVKINYIDTIKGGNTPFQFTVKNSSTVFFAHKVVLATGAGPARKLPKELKSAIEITKHNSKSHPTTPPERIINKILNYTDILSEPARLINNKRVLVYGGGATAAWAMEVAEMTAHTLGWIAKSGFEDAEKAGPRVEAIIKRTRNIQHHGLIHKIHYKKSEDNYGSVLKIDIAEIKTKITYTVEVDFIINCIGQDPYEEKEEGLPEILSQAIQNDLKPFLDKNDQNGSDEFSKIGWTNNEGNVLIIGAAQGTYYNRDKVFGQYPSSSDFLPRSGQVPITIGGVVSSVLALTNYMPFKQDETSRKIYLSGLNPHVMNATQLAVYFIACYPSISPPVLNRAVAAFMTRRSKTEFGLSHREILAFHEEFFSDLTPKDKKSVVDNSAVQQNACSEAILQGKTNSTNVEKEGLAEALTYHHFLRTPTAPSSSCSAKSDTGRTVTPRHRMM